MSALEGGGDGLGLVPVGTLDAARPQIPLVLDSGRLMLDGPLPALLGDAARLESLGLALPPVAALSAALGLPGRPTRQVDAARALARVAAGRPVP